MVNEDSSTNVYAWVSGLVFFFIQTFFRVHEFHLSITISAFHAFRVFFLPLHVERDSYEKLWIIFPFSLSHIVVFGLYHLFTLSCLFSFNERPFKKVDQMLVSLLKRFFFSTQTIVWHWEWWLVCKMQKSGYDSMNCIIVLAKMWENTMELIFFFLMAR